MVGHNRIAAAALGALFLVARPGVAQQPAVPPWWSDQTSAIQPPTSHFPELHSGATSVATCSAAACSPFEDKNGPLLKCDPLLDDSACAPPGWFGALELDLVAPVVTRFLAGPVSVGGNTNLVQLGTASLDWTVAPRLEFGYRFSQGAGELIFSYKFLVSSGDATIADFGAPGNAASLHSRIDLETWDFDYSNHENGLLPCFDMKWWAGLRVATAFYDSSATSPLLNQSASNYFWGIGPHLGFQLQHDFQSSGLGFFTRVENAWLIGEVHQAFSEVIPGPLGGATDVQQGWVVPYLSVQAGVQYSPPAFQQLCVSAGYIIERWWNVGESGISKGDVMAQGVFLRGELKY
jgi:hypothetical protein